MRFSPTARPNTWCMSPPGCEAPPANSGRRCCVSARLSLAPKSNGGYRATLLHHTSLSFQSCVNFCSHSGEEVWEGCGKVGKGLEGRPKSHSTLNRQCPRQVSGRHRVGRRPPGDAREMRHGRGAAVAVRLVGGADHARRGHERWSRRRRGEPAAQGGHRPGGLDSQMELR